MRWNYWIIKLSLQNPTHCRIVKEEYLIYDVESLVGDAGGVIGMLLGASLLGLYDGLSYIFGSACRSSDNGKRRPTNDVTK